MKIKGKVFIILLLLFANACTLQKRVYRKGYYFDFSLAKSLKEKVKDKQYSSTQIYYAHNTGENIKSKELGYQKQNSLLENNKHTLVHLSNHQFIKQEDSIKCGDKIILKSGDEYDVKVLEITEIFIKYKRCDNLTGPMYSIDKHKVYLIKYQNGTSEHIISEEKSIKPNNNTNNQQNTNTSGKKKWPDSLVIAVIFAALIYPLSIFSIYLILFFSRKADRQIAKNTQLYDGQNMAGCLNIFSKIIITVAIAGLVLIGISLNSIGYFGAANIYLTIFLILALIIAVPLVVYFITKQPGDRL